MSDELFRKIIQGGKEIGARLYSPFMNGEPFVFPRIWEWLDYMELEGVQVSLYTNAEFMDVDRLVKYTNIQYVNCSFNAATKETYDKVMRGPDYDRVLFNIRDLQKKAKFSTRISFIKSDDNIHELKQFRSMFGRTRVCGFANWAGDRQAAVERKGKRIPCLGLFTQMYILWDGTTVPCCMDYDAKQPMGDANELTIRELWKNISWMRQKHRNFDFDIPICHGCNYNMDNSIQK